MANVERALLALSGGLQQLAGNAWQRERDNALAMRQENLMRIQASLDARARQSQNEFTAGENEKSRTQAAALAQTQLESTREENRKTREFQGAQADKDRAVQRERFDREDLEKLDSSYLRQLNEIDDRLASLNEIRTKSGMEGMAPDPAALADFESQVKALQQQRAALAKDRATMLASRGDKRYPKVSAEEVARLLGQGGGEKPVAAQGPEPTQPAVDVPPMPPAEPALAERMQRVVDRNQRSAAAGREVVAPVSAEQVATNSRATNDAISGRTQVGQGARQLRDLVTNIGSRRDEGPKVGSIRETIKSGGQPSADQVAFLRGVGRERLKGVYGFKDADLQRIGL